MFRTSVSFNGKFLPNFDLKNMISTYTKEFLWEKNGPNSVLFFLPSYLLCSQIWLSFFLNDHHFGYIIKSLKRKPVLETTQLIFFKSFLPWYMGRYQFTPGVESVGGKRGVRGVLRSKFKQDICSWTGLQVSQLDPYSSRKSMYEIHEQKS